MDCNCIKCDYSWKSKGDNVPIACPRCKRYDWQKPKEDKINGEDSL